MFPYMFPYTADKVWFILSFKLSNGFMFAVFQIIIKEYFFFFCKSAQVSDTSMHNIHLIDKKLILV